MVQRGMDELMKGRTVFVIAHRLSTIRNSDAIMVLDHGRIAERGDHESDKGEGNVLPAVYRRVGAGVGEVSGHRKVAGRWQEGGREVAGR